MRPVRRSLVTLLVSALALILVVGCSEDPLPTFTLAPTYGYLLDPTATPTPAPTASSTSTARPEDPAPTALPSTTAVPPTDTPLPPTATPPPTQVVVSVWLGKDLPAALVQAVTGWVGSESGQYSLTEDASLADVQIGGEVIGNGPVATWQG